MLIGQRILDEEEWKTWDEQHRVAEQSLSNREEALAASSNIVENYLELLGSSAIEDKLQENVAETIQYFLAVRA